MSIDTVWGPCYNGGMQKTEIRRLMMRAAVKNAKEFGYPWVTEDDLFKDYVIAMFFKGMLEDEDNVGLNPTVEEVRLALLKEVNEVLPSLKKNLK